MVYECPRCGARYVKDDLVHLGDKGKPVCLECFGHGLDSPLRVYLKEK